MDKRIVTDCVIRDMMMNSDDPNIAELRERALLATKIIHAEEIEREVRRQIRRQREWEEQQPRYAGDWP